MVLNTVGFNVCWKQRNNYQKNSKNVIIKNNIQPCCYFSEPNVQFRNEVWFVALNSDASYRKGTGV